MRFALHQKLLGLLLAATLLVGCSVFENPTGDESASLRAKEAATAQPPIGVPGQGPGSGFSGGGPTPTPTATPNPTATPTPSATPTATPNPTATPTPSATPTASPTATPSTNLGYWSNPATWTGNGDQVPTNGQNVTIPAGQTIILDTDTASLGSLMVHGTLRVDTTHNVSLTAGNIMIHGSGILEAGTQQAPNPFKFTITLTGARNVHTPRTTDGGLDNDGVARGLHVGGGGTWRMFGTVPNIFKTKLNEHALAGSTVLTLADAVDWKAGDEIAISVTDFYGVAQTEIHTLAADAVGTQVTLTQPLAASRFGRLQYPTNTGVSYTPGTFTPPSAEVPTIIDERATVALLTRNIVVQGANDSDWTNNGFGCHTMIMNRASTAQISGVRFRRCGQLQAMGRYPFHWHVLSYNLATGDFLGDADPANHFLRNSVIDNSTNRAVTIHGTCGVNVSNNLAVDIKGHAFFMEDGTEQRNVIDHNIAMKVRAPTHLIKAHDDFHAGFWLTNPDNTVTYNQASDAGVGLWNSFATQAFGLSVNAKNAQGQPINPNKLVIREFDHNEGFGNRISGIMTENVVYNEAGEFGPHYYEAEYQPVFLTHMISWKNPNGYINRVTNPQYTGSTFADNKHFDFSGAVIMGHLSDGLFIGTSFNNWTTPAANEGPREAFASYHFQIPVERISATNYPLSPEVFDFPFFRRGGVTDTADFYTESVALGYLNYNNWQLINSVVGFISPPPSFDGHPLLYQSPNGSIFDRTWSTAGAIWDPHGWWGPVGNYLTFNDPYFLFGIPPQNIQPVQPAGQVAVSVPDRYFGFGITGYLPGFPLFVESVRAERLNYTMGGTVPDLTNPNAVVGVHDIPRQTGGFLPHMRNFSFKQNGAYRVTLPEGQLPDQILVVTLANAYRNDDNVIIGVPWNGSVPVSARVDSGWLDIPDFANGYSRLLTPTATVQEVFQDYTGLKYFQDSAHNLVYFSFRGNSTVMSQIAAAACQVTNPIPDHCLKQYKTVRLYPL